MAKQARRQRRRSGVKDLNPKDAKSVVGGGLSLNFTKIEYTNVPQGRDSEPAPTTTPQK